MSSLVLSWKSLTREEAYKDEWMNFFSFIWTCSVDLVTVTSWSDHNWKLTEFWIPRCTKKAFYNVSGAKLQTKVKEYTFFLPTLIKMLLRHSFHQVESVMFRQLSFLRKADKTEQLFGFVFERLGSSFALVNIDVIGYFFWTWVPRHQANNYVSWVAWFSFYLV